MTLNFWQDMEVVGLDRNLSREGMQNAKQRHLRSAIRDLRDLVQKPLDEYHAKTETMRAAATLPTFDKSDYAAGLRREMRDRSWTMTPGQRAALLTGPHRDQDFIDAVLEFKKPWVSGIDIYSPDQLEIYNVAKAERLRDLHPQLLDTVADRDNTESEARMILAVARVDIQGDSGLESRDFEAVAKVVESKIGALWIKKTTKIDGTEQVIVFEPQPDGTVRDRPATPDEARDGVEFPDYPSYLASRSAA